MSQARFLAGVRSDALEDHQRLKREREEAAAAIRKKQSGSAFGRLLGGVGLPLVASVLSGGLLSAPMLALAAGAGSRFGSEVGERGGDVVDAVKSIGFGGSKGMEDIELDKTGYRYGSGNVIDAADEVAGQTEGFGSAQWLQALSDAGTAYALGSTGPYQNLRAGKTAMGKESAQTLFKAGWGEEGKSLLDILGLGIDHTNFGSVGSSLPQSSSNLGNLLAPGPDDPWKWGPK
jgi:hypothetical protein